MTEKAYLRFWVGTFIVIGVLIWLLADVLTPFILGAGIAYFLDPLADRLESLRMPRWLATSLILGTFFLGIILVGLLVFPLLRGQISDFIAKFPGYVSTLTQLGGRLMERLYSELPAEAVRNIEEAAGASSGKAFDLAGNVLRNILSGGLALFDVLSLLLITPLVAFYMLRDWNKIMMRIDEMLPRQQAPVIRAQARAIDEIIAGFIRGQATVCLLLGAFYAIGLTLVDLNFGLLIGFFTGLFSFIPFVGMLVGFLIGLGTAIVQFDSWVPIALVVAVFAAGQIIEGHFLTPILVGTRIGLHPVWVMFGLLAGGVLFGFTGVLLAVPVAAAIGVIVRFGVERYRESSYYHGPAAD